jgi:hypothetical protein
VVSQKTITDCIQIRFTVDAREKRPPVGPDPLDLGGVRAAPQWHTAGVPVGNLCADRPGDVKSQAMVCAKTGRPAWPSSGLARHRNRFGNLAPRQTFFLLHGTTGVWPAWTIGA